MNTELTEALKEWDESYAGDDAAALIRRGRGCPDGIEAIVEAARELATGQQDRILWNRGRETIDEIVIHNATIHIEQMADNCWWVGISKGDMYWSGNFHTPRAKMAFTEQDDEEWVWGEDKEHL